MRSAVFMDRDGVLNDVVYRNGKPASPRTLSEFEFAAGAAEAVARLRDRGYLTFVVTNQPDIARGLMQAAVLDAMNERIRSLIPVDDMLVCPHDDADGCMCRKPSPGMLLTLAERWGADLGSSYMIGDSWKDMDAARSAGCRRVLIRRDYNQALDVPLVAPDLAAAVDLILADGRNG